MKKTILFLSCILLCSVAFGSGPSAGGGVSQIIAGDSSIELTPTDGRGKVSIISVSPAAPDTEARVDIATTCAVVAQKAPLINPSFTNNSTVAENSSAKYLNVSASAAVTGDVVSGGGIYGYTVTGCSITACPMTGYVINIGTDAASSSLRVRADGTVSAGYTGAAGTSKWTLNPWTGVVVSSGNLQQNGTLMMGSGVKISHNGTLTTAYTLYTTGSKSILTNSITDGFVRSGVNGTWYWEVSATSATSLVPVTAPSVNIGGLNMKGYSFDAALKLITPALYDVYWSTDTWTMWVASGATPCGFRVISSGVTPP